MKADLNSLRKELGRLADMDTLKKEMNRIRKEVKNFDINAHLTPQARARVQRLEKRWREVLKRIAELQKQVDLNLEKFMKVVKKNQASASTKRSSGGSSGGKTSRKKATKKSAGSKKATKKSAKKSSSR